MKTTRALTTTSQQRPTLEAIKALVLDSLISRHSKSSYGIALTGFISWFVDEWRGQFNRASVHAYRVKLQASGLSAATCNARIAAVKKLASEAAENGLLSNELAAGIARIKSVPKHGVRIGNWLPTKLARQLINTPDTSTLIGKRNKALFCVLIGAGLRREEACHLKFEHLQIRDGRWCVVDILGKGGRLRTVPFADWVKAPIDDWATAAGIDAGIIFRFAGSKPLDYSAARAMRATGQSWSEIAAKFGVSAETVRRACMSQATGSRLQLGKPLTPQAILDRKSTRLNSS